MVASMESAMTNAPICSAGAAESADQDCSVEQEAATDDRQGFHQLAHADNRRRGRSPCCRSMVEQPWLVICDWNSQEGTFLEGQRIRRCRPLNDGDEISLGKRGPVLVFRLTPNHSKPLQSPLRGFKSGNLEFGGLIRMDQIQSVQMISRARYPASFSWWALISLGSLVVLPWPVLFWTLELAAVAGWIVFGSRKEHVLLVTLDNGMGYRHGFDSKVTALAHRNGIRKAIGQTAADRR